MEASVSQAMEGTVTDRSLVEFMETSQVSQLRHETPPFKMPQYFSLAGDTYPG